jgi:hypothetical protein
MSNAYTNALIAALPSMTINQLRHKWRDVYESEPPKFNRGYLEARLAYRLQELTFRSLSPECLKRMRALHQENANEKSRFNKRRTNKYFPPAGTILVREFRGQEYRVCVLEEGFEYNGRTYQSLTRIAHMIGAPWSGPSFFGLVRHGV